MRLKALYSKAKKLSRRLESLSDFRKRSGNFRYLHSLRKERHPLARFVEKLLAQHPGFRVDTCSASSEKYKTKNSGYGGPLIIRSYLAFGKIVSIIFPSKE
jgi:hypothetical protein